MKFQPAPGLRRGQACQTHICGVPGDAFLPLEGFPGRVAPSSTVICALLWNGLVAETARLLIESGMEPPVFVSLNVAGAAQHNQALLDKWRPCNMHL